MHVMQRLISALYPTPKGAGFTAHLIKASFVRIFLENGSLGGNKILYMNVKSDNG